MRVKNTFKNGEEQSNPKEQAKMNAWQGLAADMHDVRVIGLGKMAKINAEKHNNAEKVKPTKVLVKVEKSGVEM